MQSLLNKILLFSSNSTVSSVEILQILRKVENNEARPKFTGSYKKKRVYEIFAATSYPST